MFKKKLVVLVVLGALSTLGAKDIKVNSPFLVTGKMPHFTKMVKKHWDSSELNLTKDQKSTLLEIREKTVKSIKELKPKINSIEDEIVKNTLLGATPDTLDQKVKELSKLKAKATMVHIECIYDSKKVLTKEQLEFLQK